jgi:hypothetical protein
MGYNSKPFQDSYTLKNFINKLIIKCDFVDKGCEIVFELGLLSKHLEECNYNICESCGYKMGKKEDHNCIELLKAENNNLKNENMKLRQQMTGQTIEIRSDITTMTQIISYLEPLFMNLNDRDLRPVFESFLLKPNKTKNQLFD